VAAARRATSPAVVSTSHSATNPRPIACRSTLLAGLLPGAFPNSSPVPHHVASTLQVTPDSERPQCPPPPCRLKNPKSKSAQSLPRSVLASSTRPSSAVGSWWAKEAGIHSLSLSPFLAELMPTAFGRWLYSRSIRSCMTARKSTPSNIINRFW
jgi:hypothetical protein